MKRFTLALALVASLFAFGADQAQAASPFCFDFSAFCDCITVNIVSDNTGGQPTRRYAATWENQDCAGTTSQLQGGQHDNSYAAGELNSVLGLDGVNFNFTWRSNGAFDLDTITFGKIQDNSPYVIVPGACPADCSAAAKPQGLASSTGR
jgi:hypothetical protein